MSYYLDAFFDKPIPKSILIFGASGRIGGPTAAYITRTAPDIKLRLSTSKADGVAALQAQFPMAEVVVSSYYDLPALEAACDGMEGIFCLTTEPTNEQLAMGNLVAAVKKSGTLVHMVRQLGLTPDMAQSRLPESIKALGVGLPVSHPLARNILDDAELPVTFLNTGATFMNNFVRFMAPSIQRERKLIWLERRVPIIDTDDVGEIAGRLLLSKDNRYVGRFITVNNGQDLLNFEEMAALMSDVWGEEITFDGSWEGFKEEYAHIGDMVLNILRTFFEYERTIEPIWCINGAAEAILGRKPKSLRDWLAENKHAILGA